MLKLWHADDAVSSQELMSFLSQYQIVSYKKTDQDTYVVIEEMDAYEELGVYVREEDWEKSKKLLKVLQAEHDLRQMQAMWENEEKEEAQQVEQKLHWWQKLMGNRKKG